jgi:hypothetical protein
MDADIVLGGVAFDLETALGAAAEVGWPFRLRVSLSLQRLIEHLLGQHLPNGLDCVLDFGEFRSPRRPLVAIQALHEAFGDAFEVGANRIGSSGGDLVASHPWHLS